MGEDVEDGISGRCNEVLELSFETVWMFHSIYIVGPRGDFEGWGRNRPHDIRGFDPWDEQVVSVDRYGRVSAAERDQ